MPNNIPTQPISSSDPIVIPEGKTEAPFDSRICYTNIGGITIPTIEQTVAGNCAEYAALDTSLIATNLGYKVGEELKIFLNRDSLEYAKDHLEAGFVLPVLQSLHEIQRPCGFSVSQQDRNNLLEKQQNIYTALEGTNAALLFWAMLNGAEKDCPSNNLHTNYTQELDSRLRSTQDLAILIGDVHAGHATAILKSNGCYFSIDSMRLGHVVQSESADTTTSNIQNLLNQRRGYILLSNLQDEE